LHADLTVGAALAGILRSDLSNLIQWEHSARSWDDIEGVHQMRVACRRMRAALSSFRSAFPEEVSRHWSQELGWVASQLGSARDLDVFIDEGLGSVRGKLPLAGEEKLLALAERQRARAYDAVRSMLDGERYANLKRDFPGWIDESSWTQAGLTPKERKKLDMSIKTYSRDLLDRMERRVLEAGTDLDKNNPEQMHRLRIECKKLRYAAEFFTPIIHGLDVFILQMKGLQDLLGVLNDVSIMSGLLDAMLAGQSDPEVIRYSGGLVGWRTRQYFELLDGFEDRWQAFVHAKHPWWQNHRDHNE